MSMKPMASELRLEAEDAFVPFHAFNKMIAFSYLLPKKIQQLKEQGDIF